MRKTKKAQNTWKKKGCINMKFILVSHGSYSKGLLESVQMLVGEQENLVAYGLYPEDSIATLVEKLKEEIEKSGEQEILFLTDLFHGSPFNAVVSLMEHYDVYHVTGISLPLLLDAIMQRNSGSNAEEICEGILSLAQETVKDVGKYLKEEMCEL